MNARFFTASLVTASFLALSGCGIAKNYNEAEQEMASTMTPSKYQPATRNMRANIETQDLLAQAAFWSREYQLNPTDLESAVKLASAVRKMGNATKALEITQMTRAMHPNDPYLIAEHAAALIALERGEEATRPLDTALRSAPNYARLWSLKGAALDQTENYDLARQHYGRALQLTPSDPNIMANMGLSFALGGDPATAEQWLRRAAGHPNANDSIKHNLDLVLQLQGKAPIQPNRQAASMASAAPQNIAPQSQRRLQQAPQSPFRSSAPQPYAATSSPAPTIGHRSNMTIAGQQPGAPQTASEMARAAAAKSAQSRVVVPYNQSAQPQAAGNILDQISQSVNQKRTAAQPNYPQTRQMQPPAMQAPQGYPQQMPTGQTRATAQYGTPYGYHQAPNTGAAPQRRGAARAR